MCESPIDNLRMSRDTMLRAIVAFLGWYGKATYIVTSNIIHAICWSLARLTFARSSCNYF